MHYQNELKQCDTVVYKVESCIELIVIDRSTLLKEQLTSLQQDA